MSIPLAVELRAKVDAYLKDALAESDVAARKKLLGKAVHWNGVAILAEAPPLQFRGSAPPSRVG